MLFTEKMARAAVWSQKFEAKNFKAFTTDSIPGLSMMHVDGRIEYRVKGVGTTDSLSQAIKWVNREEKYKTAGKRSLPGSVESIRDRKKAGLRR